MKLRILLVCLFICVIAFTSLLTNAAGLPSVSPGGISLILGSNLGCWGVNGDGSINEPFMTNTGQQSAAKAGLGIMRFPCRTFTDSQIISIVNKIRSQNIEPLCILPSSNQTRAVQIVTALKGLCTIYEFGNEDNWFNGWSGATYASHWVTDVPKLRTADANAKFGGPVGSHFDTTGSAYLRDFLTNIKGKGCNPDFISMHVYAEHGEDTADQAVIDKAHSWGTGIDQMRADSQSIIGATFPIAITEWNWDAAPEQTADDRQHNATFMHNFNFAVLDEWKAHGVWMSCEYDFGAGAGGGKLDMYNHPQYTAFVDWKNANPPGSSTPTITLVSTPTPTATTTPGSEQVFPAENGTLAGGAAITNSANAENGAYVGNLHLSGASDTISGVNGGSGGSFNLTIRYATNDTNPTLNLYINGALIRTLTFTKTNGWETFSNLTTSITLNSGSGNTIMLKHDSANTGGANLDTFRVPGVGATPTATKTPTPTTSNTPTATKTPTPTATPSGGTTTRYEGENATGVNQVDTWPSGYSGTGIGVKYPSTAMTWTKNFAGGTYSFKVHCNDYSGTQTFYIQLDAVDKGGPYTMTAGDKSWKDFTGSFGTISAGNHTIGLRVPGTGSSNVYCDYIEVTGP